MPAVDIGLDIDTQDTLNRFLVSGNTRGEITVMMLNNRRFTPAECANLAAWLLAVSAVSFDKFKELYERVCST